MLPRYLVVSGLPGSGKTTLARRLGVALRLAVLDKDDVLERLFPDGGTVTADERRVLSRRADDEFIDTVTRTPAAILVSFWRRPEISTTSGTPTEWLWELPAVVEIQCDCSPEVAAERFANRARHPGHGDPTLGADDRLDTFRRIRALGPLGLPTVVSVSTEGPVDIDHLVALVTTPR